MIGYVVCFFLGFLIGIYQQAIRDKLNHWRICYHRWQTIPWSMDVGFGGNSLTFNYSQDFRGDYRS